MDICKTIDCVEACVKVLVKSIFYILAILCFIKYLAY